jgi:hypothetical protein
MISTEAIRNCQEIGKRNDKPIMHKIAPMDPIVPGAKGEYPNPKKVAIPVAKKTMNYIKDYSS